MFNTLVMDINSTSVPFSFKVCLNGVYLGMVVAYVAMSLSFILGTPVHSWFLWLSLRAGWKIKPTRVFLLNLTILELIYSFQSAIQMANVLIFRSGTLWTVICIVFGLSCVGRPLMQMCICIEQYLAVLHPIMFLKYKCVQYRLVFAAVVWLMAAGYGVYALFTVNFPNPMFNAVFFISVMVISFCCVSVLRALKNPGPGDTQIPVERGRDVGNQQKRNAFNTIFSGLLIILFVYLPVISLSFIHTIKTDKELMSCNIVPITITFNIWGMITPLLKMYKNGDLKCLKHQRKVN